MAALLNRLDELEAEEPSLYRTAMGVISSHLGKAADAIAGGRADLLRALSRKFGEVGEVATNCDASFKRAVDAGAKPFMQPADMFWGDRCGGVADPYGYRWSFASRVKNLSGDEMVRAGEEFVKQWAAGKR
jgi:hypothetical protein